MAMLKVPIGQNVVYMGLKIEKLIKMQEKVQ